MRNLIQQDLGMFWILYGYMLLAEKLYKYNNKLNNIDNSLDVLHPPLISDQIFNLIKK